jgi:hypothetical protein
MAAKGRKKTSTAKTGAKAKVKVKAAKTTATKVAAKTAKKTATKKVAAKTSATKKAAPFPKRAPPKKTETTAVKETRVRRSSAAPTTKTSPESARGDESQVPAIPPPAPHVPIASPSERLLATRGEVPTERSLTDEEREAMAKVSETARRLVGAKGAPTEIIGSIAAFLDDVRLGKREEPTSQDVRLGLGVLWGEQLRAQVGWRWVHLSYPDGFASYALVPDDRAFACFPLNRVPEALRKAGTNTSARVFESIRENVLPARKENAYLVIG